jgi:type IV pilus assembly protein PilC
MDLCKCQRASDNEVALFSYPAKVRSMPPSIPNKASRGQAQATTLRDDSGLENANSFERIFGGAPLKVLEAYCRRMSTGLRSGVDLLRLLDMETKAGTPRHRDVASNMIGLVRSGHTLADAMQKQGLYFPPLLNKVVDAGEHAGGLDRVFREMADYYQDLKRSKADFISQITFPVIQLVLAVLIGAALVYINGFFRSGSPNEPAFDLTGIGLRGGTGLMIYVSVVSIFFGTIGIVAFGLWKNWFGCHKTLIPLVRNVPVIGTVLTTTAMSRLSMTLSMMLGAGVEAKRSVRDAILSTGNHYYISGLEQTLAEIGKGRTFAESLDAPKLLPEDFIQAMEIGEVSGSGSESLERMAVMYREKAQLALKQLAIMAGVAISIMIAAIIIAAIFMIFFQVLAIYSGALKM